ncbi:MAG: hypothetical protein ACK4NC_06815 [Candidatus Gracilibacteria bacterium]
MLNTALIKGRVSGLIPTAEHVTALSNRFIELDISEKRGEEFLELWDDQNSYSLALPDFKKLVDNGYTKAEIKGLLDEVAYIGGNVKIPLVVGMKIWEISLRNSKIFSDLIKIALSTNVLKTIEGITEGEGIFKEEAEIFAQDTPWEDTKVYFSEDVVAGWETFIKILEKVLLGEPSILKAIPLLKEAVADENKNSAEEDEEGAVDEDVVPDISGDDDGSILEVVEDNDIHESVDHDHEDEDSSESELLDEDD